jgi:hypothetical protein
MRKDYKKLVNYCHRQAEAVKTEEGTIMDEVYAIKMILERNDHRDTSEKHILIGLI